MASGSSSPPLFSVVIDTYNQERFIEEAIRSVLEQDFSASEREILVVDDGSTDSTAEVVRKFEARVRLLQKSNGGQASAINFGIANARGKLIAFLDGDDWWLPNKLSRVAGEFERNPGLVMVYNRYDFWVESRQRDMPGGYFSAVNGDILADRGKLLSYAAAPTSSLTFRRDILAKLTPVPEDCFFMHDLYLISTVTCLGPVAAIDERLTRNRIHGDNLWFTDSRKPDPVALYRRMQARQAAMVAIGKWSKVRAPQAVQAQMQLFIDRWQLLQEDDSFGIDRPGRLRYFRYLARAASLYGPGRTLERRAYEWFYAFASLFLGYRYTHYIEGVRTRAKWLAEVSSRRAARPAKVQQ